ncbi:hypothetical protein [Photorhabdus khanii]|uniref:Uncharacterized protein n=1 Tax=Photorhabdus khanii subsp. guanajuatensis TaxID=2100166 RepID=A0A4R4IPR7_9GAMM|nr:hypothetical protein [Photorhabdus khanii]TDB42618.1 hypothetical protein C5467_23750 [Photorhabdus khanii subsp. guanajuatensis]
MSEIGKSDISAFFSAMKKYAIYALKIMPFYVVLSVFIVWGYLGHFSRLDLFMSSIDNKITLVYILISFFLISISISMIIIFPSFILILFSSFVDKSYIGSTRRIPSITYISSISMLASFFIFSSDAFLEFLKEYIYLEKVFFLLGKLLELF